MNTDLILPCCNVNMNTDLLVVVDDRAGGEDESVKLSEDS